MPTGSEPFDGLAGTIYDLYVKVPALAQVAGRVAWGLDARRMYEHMERGVRAAADSRVALDVPCGGGVALRWLRPQDRVRFVAVDGAAHMVERARRYARGRGLRQVELRRADVTELPLADHEVDVVLVFNGIHHFRDPAAALSEIGRCTRPRGRIFGVTFVLGLHARSDRLLRRAQRAGTLGPAGAREDVAGWLRDAGFDVTRATTSGSMLLFEGARG